MYDNYTSVYQPYYAWRNQTGDVVSSQWGDVNGDGVPDLVYLTGTKTADSPFTQNIQLHVRCGKTNQTYTVQLKENMGYNPGIFLGDFTGDQVNDILVSIDSGGSGAFTYNYLYSFLNNQPRLLYDNDSFVDTYSKGAAVNYMDDYRVQITIPALNKRYILDISDKGRDYLDQLYDANGRLKQPTEGSVMGVSGAYPIDLDRDGIYELMPFQRVIGLYNADGLGYLETPLSWDKGHKILTPMYQLAAIFGSDLNR